MGGHGGRWAGLVAPRGGAAAARLAVVAAGRAVLGLSRGSAAGRMPVHSREKKENNHDEMEVDYGENEGSTSEEEETESSSVSEEGDSSGIAVAVSAVLSAPSGGNRPQLRPRHCRYPPPPRPRPPALPLLRPSRGRGRGGGTTAPFRPPPQVLVPCGPGRVVLRCLCGASLVLRSAAGANVCLFLSRQNRAFLLGVLGPAWVGGGLSVPLTSSAQR